MIAHNTEFKAVLREFTMKVLDEMYKNRHNNRLLENHSLINSFLETEESKEADILREKLLERYEIKDIIYSGVEDMMRISLNEDFFDISKDKEEISNDISSLKRIIPDLMARLIKLGAKKTVNLIVRGAKAAYKAGKSTPEIVKETFYCLLFLAIGLFGNSTKEKYNEHPVIPGTQIETTTVDGNEAMVVYGDDETIVVTQEEDNMAPVVIKAVDNKDAKFNSVSPIRLLGRGEQKIRNHRISNEMFTALAEVEHFVNHIYDTADRNRRITRNDMKNMKLDLTIGYGHKLTPEERRNWSPNKKISKQQALKLFKQDILEREIQTNNLLRQLPYDSKVEYSQGFYDAFFSLLYNCGYRNIKESDFWRRLTNCRIDKQNGCINKSDIEYSLAKINTQNVFMKGHKTRRRAEYFIAMQPYGKVKASLYKLKG